LILCFLGKSHLHWNRLLEGPYEEVLFKGKKVAYKGLYNADGKMDIWGKMVKKKSLKIFEKKKFYRENFNFSKKLKKSFLTIIRQWMMEPI